MKTILTVVLAIVIVAGAVLLYEKHDSDTGTMATSSPVQITTSTSTPKTVATSSIPTQTTTTTDLKVTSPANGQKVSSPLNITGEARGNWFFEASAPVYLTDAAGHKLASGSINAQGDWMTTNFVPFTATLTWTASSTGSGFVVFENSNPSGDPSFQKSVKVPVAF